MRKILSLLPIPIIALCAFFVFSSPAIGLYNTESFIAPDGESYVFGLKWGSLGNLNDEFNAPHGVAVDISGNIWVTDNVNDRIIKFDSSGNFLLTIGSTGAGPGQLNGPEGIDVDTAGNIWVADYSNGRVQKLNSLGQQLCQIAGLSGPEGVAVDRNTANVFISNIDGLVKSHFLITI